MKFVIWNKTDVDTIDVILLSELIKVKVNEKTIFSKPIEKKEDIEIYEKILDDIKKINEVYYKDDENKFKELSNKFFEKLENY